MSKKPNCIAIEPDILAEIDKKRADGITKTFIVNESLKLYLGMKNDKISLELPSETLLILRKECIASSRTANEVINDCLKRSLNASPGQESDNQGRPTP